MQKYSIRVLFALVSGVAFATISSLMASAGVTVSSPTQNATVTSPVHYVATGKSSCSKGVAAMGIYSAPNVLAYKVNGSKLDTNLVLSPGSYKTVVEQWDYCGDAATVPINITVTNQSDVQVSSPSNNSTVSTPVHFVATASTSCSKGTAAMGIYSAPGVLAYKVDGASLDTSLSLAPGTYNTTVQSWDFCGGAGKEPITITVKQSGSGVYVTTPTNNSTVTSPVQFVATATTTCSKGVAAMGIYTAPGVLSYTVNGASLNTALSLSPGDYNTTVQSWDKCGGSAKAPINLNVVSGEGGVASDLQKDKNWIGYILLPPVYDICDWCKATGPEVTWSTQQGISSPSLSGSSMKFNIGGDTVYSDVLWTNHIIGDGSPILDGDRKILPSIHNFVYDVYFYGTHLELSEALEFDLALYVNGGSYLFGTECRITAGTGNNWAIWDNPTMHWLDTGIACFPKSNDWNHLTLQVQRTTDGHLLYQSITLNGEVHNLNKVLNPGSSNWYGAVVNFQMDGNHAQQPYSVWLDKLNVTYW